jgi:dynein intermediate chain, cytosolic
VTQIGPTVYASTSTQTLSVTPLRTVYESSSIHSEPEPKQSEVVSYDRGTQTNDDWEPQRDGQASNVERPAEQEQREIEQERIRAELRKEIEEEVRSALDRTKPETGQQAQEGERYPMRTLSEEELEAVLHSSEFVDFVDKSTKVMERALDEDYDILVDYTQGSGSLDDEDETYGKGRLRRGRRVKQISQFWDEKWSKRRMISDIGFSPKVSLFT